MSGRNQAPGLMTDKKFNWLMDIQPEDSSKKIQCEKDASELINRICSQKDSVEVLQRITYSNCGLIVLKESLSIENNVDFVKKFVIRLIRFIGADERFTVRPSALKILRTIFKAPSLFDQMVNYVIDRKLEQDECMEIGWLVLQVIKGGDEFAAEAKRSHHVERLANALSSGEYPMTKTVSAQINTMLDQLYKVEIEDIESPGWRHSNDKVDFHEISSYPTADELTDGKEAFLPLTDRVLEKPPNISADERKVGTYLDWTFRLLREVIIQDVKEEINLLLRPSLSRESNYDPMARLKTPSFEVIQFREITCHQRFGVGFKVEFKEPKKLADEISGLVQNSARPKTARELQTQNSGETAEIPTSAGPGACAVLGLAPFCSAPEISKPQMSKNARDEATQEFWGDRPSFLKQQSIVAFVRGMKARVAGASGLELVGLGIVQVRELKELMKSPPSVDVFLFDGKDMRRAVLEVRVEQQDLHAVQLSAPFFAFEPVLERLKMLSTVPFEEELLHDAQSQEPRYFKRVQTKVEELESMSASEDLKPVLNLQQTTKLDESQKLAVTQSLRNRVALIQGPPGTGKSYCGAIISKIIHDNTDEKILCVCYTNHALDQFMEGLIDFGLPTSEIARIGGSEKMSDRIKPFSVINLLKQMGRRDPSGMFRTLRNRLPHLQEEIRKHERYLVALNTTTRLDYFAQYFDDDSAAAFQMPKPDDDEFQFASNKAGKPLDEDYLWKRWLDGRDRGVVSKWEMGPAPKKLWYLPKESRLSQVGEWRKKLIKPYMADLEKWMAKYQDVLDQQAELNQRHEIDLLRSKRIIGCTTTGEKPGTLATFDRDQWRTIENSSEIFREEELRESRVFCGGDNEMSAFAFSLNSFSAKPESPGEFLRYQFVT